MRDYLEKRTEEYREYVTVNIDGTGLITTQFHSRFLHNPAGRNFNMSTIRNGVSYNREFKSCTDLTYVVPRSKVIFLGSTTSPLFVECPRVKLLCRNLTSMCHRDARIRCDVSLRDINDTRSRIRTIIR